MIWAAADADPKVQVFYCCKSFSIADAITFIKASMDELKPETVNSHWKGLWSEAVYDSKSFQRIDGEVKKIIQKTREVFGEGLVDMIDEEVEEHFAEQQEVLTN